MSSEKFREEVLISYGADASEVQELLAYNQNVFQHEDCSKPLELPLPSEVHLDDWEEYAAQAEVRGAYSVLKDVFVQWQFPIQQGISQTEAYRSATLKTGSVDRSEEASLVFQHPEEIELTIHHSLAGAIPVLLVKHREDFVTVVRSLTKRNEPEPIPLSMGACIVSGYNNWARIRNYQNQWCEQNPDCDDEAWNAEFQRLIARRELYQDRFLILSNEFYSNTAPEKLDLTEAQWRDFSHKIRLEHECTHYFTYRLFASMRNNLLDELIADYMGIVAANGSYRADWFLQFMGLEAPHYREGGRLENYRGEPPLSGGAFKILQKLVQAAAINLERCDRAYVKQHSTAKDRSLMAFGLTHLNLEELASDRAIDRLEAVLASLNKNLLIAN